MRLLKEPFLQFLLLGGLICAFTFGLLHGFGFAGALSEIGLQPHDIPLAPLPRNAGVETGHLLFVSAVLLTAAVVKRLAASPPAWLRPVPAYGIARCAAIR